MNASAARLGVVVLTYNRRLEVLRTLDRLIEIGEGWPICVVDNASSDGTGATIAQRHRQVVVLHMASNLGAAARNYGVAYLQTPYVACCDDDTWWAPGSLARAVELMDAYPHLAAVTARVLVGADNREDPASTIMAASPLPNRLGFPGNEVAGLLGGPAWCGSQPLPLSEAMTYGCS